MNNKDSELKHAHGHPGLSRAEVDSLHTISSATLTTLLLKRGLRNQYIQGVTLMNANAKRLIGRAFTLRYIPAREDLSTVESFKRTDHPQRVAVETVPSGDVLVMDCRRDASAASLGGILATRLALRGCAGVVSDAGVRDVALLTTLDMPVFAAGPSAPTNLTRHEAIDINVPVGCGGVAVYPGDIVVGDADGVVILPMHMASALVSEGLDMEAFEDFALMEVRKGRPVIGTYPPNSESVERYERYKIGKYP